MRGKSITGGGTTLVRAVRTANHRGFSRWVRSRSRTVFRFSLGRLIPLLLPAREDRFTIFGQNPVLLNQIVHRFRVTNDVLFAAPVAFLYRTSRVPAPLSLRRGLWKRDRKSTRLNSSHTVISYAVF